MKNNYKGLEKKYGERTTMVVKAKITKREKDLTRLRLRFGSSTVAAILSNLSRGTYEEFVSYQGEIYCIWD